MTNVLNILPGAHPAAKNSIMYMEVAAPAPTSFDDPLILIMPEWSTTNAFSISDWPALYGTALPPVGNAVLCVTDDQNNTRVVWWSGTVENGLLNSGTNVLWVDPILGDAVNSGAQDDPLDSMQTAIDQLSAVGAFLTGKWQIQMAAGTYSSPATIDYTARNFRTYYPLQILGPNVAPQLGAPAGLAVQAAGTGSSFAGGQKYYWGVTALNGNGETPVSNVVSATPSAGQNGDLTWDALTPPSSEINTSQPAATQTISGYNVYRATSELGLSASPAFVGTTTTPSFTDTGASTTTGSAPATDTTGSQPSVIIDGTGQPAGSAGLTLFGDMNVWLYNLLFQNWQGTNADPSRGVYSGAMNCGNLRIEDCCAQLCDFGVDALNAEINVFGNSQFLNNTTNGWGFGLETKNSGWVDVASTARGVTLIQGNLVGLYVAESSDSHPVAAQIDDNQVGVHVSRCTRFETDGLSLSRNAIGVQGHLVAAIEDVGSNWWDGTDWANTLKYDLGMYAAQADSGASYGRSERVRCIDPTGYVLTGPTGISNLMWDSNGAVLGAAVTPSTSTPPDPWQIQANFLVAAGHRLTVKAYCTLIGTAGTKAVTLKIGGQQVAAYTFSAATTVGGWIEFIVAPTGQNTQTVWRNAFVNGNSNLPVESAETVSLGGSTVSTAQSVQLYGLLGAGADTLTINLIEVSEV